MIKMSVVHVSGPKMTPEYRFTVENQPGGMAAFQDKITERTVTEMAELNTLISEGYEKFDAQKFTFSDGEAIIYLLYKPDPTKYVVESRWLTTDEKPDWEPAPDPYMFDDSNAAFERQRDLSTISRDYQFRVRSVNHA